MTGIPVGEVFLSRPDGAEEIEALLMDPSVFDCVDTLLSHVQTHNEVPELEHLIRDLTKAEEAARLETELTPNRLEGLGKEKVEKLRSGGIVTVEALARVEVDHADKDAVALAMLITGNRRKDGALRTLSGWKARAVDYLERRATIKR
mmetsp:Transcript_17746/g.55584  ORF Transcript_17746/g.55584 Transcript_17746/m.55584 type:complete len:148 (-) Transcript_17746:587-1030(-)